MVGTPGFTNEEIREFVSYYHLIPHGQKGRWIETQPFSRHQLRNWSEAVFGGDLDRNLIPRETSDMTPTPKQRTAFERDLASERQQNTKHVDALNARIRELEEVNDVLGKAIGLLQVRSAHEPTNTPIMPTVSSSSIPKTISSEH